MTTIAELKAKLLALEANITSVRAGSLLSEQDQADLADCHTLVQVLGAQVDALKRQPS